MEMEKGTILSMLKTYCRENFIAITTEENETLTLRFPNGQKFSVSVEKA